MLYGAMNVPVFPVLDELEEIARLGFDYVELTMDAPAADHKTLRRQRDFILKNLERSGTGLVCHLPTFLSPADLTESLREASVNELLESLEVATDLGAWKAVIHPAHIRGLGPMVLDQAKGYAMDCIGSAVNRAKNLGLMLCLENLGPQSRFLFEPEGFAEVLDRFPSLNMTLDVGHACLQDESRRRALDFLDRFSKRIGHIHVSDNFGTEDSHLPIGAGSVDFTQFIKGLKSIGYNDTITLEVFSQDRDYLRISKEKLTKMVETM